jgi:hypothetical protein
VKQNWLIAGIAGSLAVISIGATLCIEPTIRLDATTTTTSTKEQSRIVQLTVEPQTHDHGIVKQQHTVAVTFTLKNPSTTKSES